MTGLLPVQMATAWGNLRGSLRALLDSEPSEGKLFFIAMLSGLLHFAGTMLVPPPLTGAELQAWVGAEFISALLWRSLALYGVAALACWVLGRFGGSGGWKDSRAAVFWAMLVVAPLILALSVLAVLSDGPLTPWLAQIGGLAMAWVLAAMLAEAHGFRQTWTLFAGMVGVSLALVLLARFLVSL